MWTEIKQKVKYKSWMNIQMNELHGIGFAIDRR